MASRSKFHKLQGKHVLIFGGSSGIGYGVAEGALAGGAAVTVASSGQPKVDAAVAALKAEYPGQEVLGLAADLSSPDVEAEIEAVFRKAEAAHGQVHHVVLTAAAHPHVGPLAEVTPDVIAQLSRTRLVAPLILAKVAARHLEPSTSSSLTLTSGTVTEKPQPGWTLTASLAAGVQNAAKGLALDLAPVRVNVVRPGAVHTPLWDGLPEAERARMFDMFSKTLLTGGIGRPEDAAEAYLWLMRDKNVTGTMAATDGGALLV